jgi:cysteinyl-tRNA synthetase
MAVLFELANKVNAGDKHLAGQLKALGGVLGLLQRRDFLQAKPADVSEESILSKIAEREAARKRKDYAAADRIRKELLEQGIALEDKGGKTTWRRA